MFHQVPTIQPMGSDFQANQIKHSFVDNFRFTKAEDILFALEMNSKSEYNLLYKRINEKFAKATVNTSIIEAIATVVLRCFDKDATEELYLINLLTFDSQKLIDGKVWLRAGN